MESNHKQCSICHEEIDYYAYGACNHPTCTKCVLKLRKFGSVDEPDYSKCATCRRNVNKIVIMETFIPFDEIVTAEMRHDPQYDFMYATVTIENHYKDMLKSVCPICGEEKKSLSALNRHTTTEHQLSYCDLCIRFSRLLPCEFLPMKPSELTEHRKWDKNRKRGHPLCDFCEERFYEMEDLVGHIRDKHFLCDLCMNAGKFEVFREQWELLQHYGDAHYLCTECRQQQRISCFASEERLGLHRFQEHPNEVAADPNSWLPVSIQMASTNLDSSGARRLDGRSGGVDRVGGVLSGTDGQLVAEEAGAGVRFRRPNPAEWTGDDFPSLRNDPDNQTTPSNRREAPTRSGEQSMGSIPAANRSAAPSSTLAAVTSRGRSGQLTTDDFPSLGNGALGNGQGSTPRWTKANGRMPASNTNAPQSHRPRAAAPTQTTAEFPGLPSSTSSSNRPSTNWKHSTQPRGDETHDESQSTKFKSTYTPVPQAMDFPNLAMQGGRSGGSSNHTLLPPYQRPTQAPKLTKKAAFQQQSRAVREESDALMAAAPVPGAKTKLRQQRNPDLRHALSQPWEANAVNGDEETEMSKYTHIRSVDALPSSGTVAAVIQPMTQPTTDDFPTLKNQAPGGKQKKQHGNSKSSSTSQNGTSNSSTASKGRTQAPKPTKPIKVQDPWPLPPCSLIDTECILFADVTYVPVTDAETRNRKLIHAAEDYLSELGGKTTFTRFADLSRRYSHKELSATAYVEGLIGMVNARVTGRGEENGSASSNDPLWIAPMIALLPNVGLQRALLRVIRGQGAPRVPQDQNPNPQSNRSRPKEHIMPAPIWAKKVLSQLLCCQTCGQVCLRSDLTDHGTMAHSET